MAKAKSQSLSYDEFITHCQCEKYSSFVFEKDSQAIEECVKNRFLAWEHVFTDVTFFQKLNTVRFSSNNLESVVHRCIN